MIKVKRPSFTSTLEAGVISLSLSQLMSLFLSLYHTLSVGDVTHSLALVVTADTNSMASASSNTTGAFSGSYAH
jgi:hypothetical protein